LPKINLKSLKNSHITLIFKTLCERIYQTTILGEKNPSLPDITYFGNTQQSFLAFDTPTKSLVLIRQLKTQPEFEEKIK